MAKKPKYKDTSEKMQFPLLPPESSWRAPTMDELPSWKGAKRVSIDCETFDPHLKELGCGAQRDGKMVGVSFYLDGMERAFYLPFGHLDGQDNMDAKQVLRYLKAQAKSFTGDVVGANLSYDLDYFSENGIEFPQVKFFRDVQVADPLIYELHQQYSLQKIAERWGFAGKNESLLEEAANLYGVSPKGGLWKLPGRYVGPYAEEDAKLPMRLIKLQEKKIASEDLQEIYDLESQVLPVLVRMRRRGMRIDLDQLEKVETWSLDEQYEAVQELNRHITHKIGVNDLWKAEAVAPALEAAGIKLGRTSKGQPEIQKGFLEAHPDNKVAKAFLRARELDTLRNTFAKGLRKHIIDGRVHCTFNQMRGASDNEESGQEKGVRYGRLSASNPNLQNQPGKRSPFYKQWRSIYLPEEGMDLAAPDYSQQEPRWTTYFAAITQGGLPGAREALQRYIDDPSMDNHTMMADITGVERDMGKKIFLSLCYGEGGAKMSDDLGLPTRYAAGWMRNGSWHTEYYDNYFDADMAARQNEGNSWRAAGPEVQAMLDQFNEKAPYVKALQKAAGKAAAKRGWIKTFCGRKLHFIKNEFDGKFENTYRALNRIIQGSGADQMKKALVEIDREGIFLQLQVHDEAGASVSGQEEGIHMATIMRDTIKIDMPFKVDLALGKNWGVMEEMTV